MNRIVHCALGLVIGVPIGALAVWILRPQADHSESGAMQTATGPGTTISPAVRPTQSVGASPAAGDGESDPGRAEVRTRSAGRPHLTAGSAVVARFIADVRGVYSDKGLLPLFDLTYARVPTTPLGVRDARELSAGSTPPESAASLSFRFRQLNDELGTQSRTLGLGSFHVAALNFDGAFETTVGIARGGLEGGPERILGAALSASDPARRSRDLSPEQRASFGRAVEAWQSEVARFHAKVWTTVWPSMRAVAESGGGQPGIAGLVGYRGEFYAVERGADPALDEAIARVLALDEALGRRLREISGR